MERGSDKHSPRLDDEMAHETGSLTGGAPIEARSEEFREQEGPADGEPTPDSRIRSADASSDSFEARAELARHLQPSVFPANRERLIASAHELHAPDDVVDALSRLPDGTFDHLQAVWEALGGREELRQ